MLSEFSFLPSHPFMASSSSLSLLLFTLLSLLSFSISSPSPLTLSLSPYPTKLPSSDPWRMLNHLATSSLNRAHHLKNPKTHIKTNTEADTVTDTKTEANLSSPLFPHSYGGYSINLSFGTPSQTLTFVMDTGSSLVWFPCTSRYACSKCNFPNVKTIPTFIPKKSSSAKIVGCKSPKCSLIFGPDVSSRCTDCSSDPATNPNNCTQKCPPYLIQYGSGNTVGILLSDKLVFPKSTVSDFLVGCSVFSTRQPAGIAGFGRGPESLPAQMGLSRFSYCLLSRRFDDTGVSSDLTLDYRSGDGKTDGLTYTPFWPSPKLSSSAFQDYYYLNLRKIVVGDKSVKIPYKYLVPDNEGNGGTIVDSGSTFTFMERPVFQAVVSELEKQMRNYTRAKDVEMLSGLRPCFDISKAKSVVFPELGFHFKGGAKLALPLENYFAFVGKSGVVCLTIVSDSGGMGPSVSGGPAIIFGNFQQQNLLVEYDLENERFGFKKQNCQKA